MILIRYAIVLQLCGHEYCKRLQIPPPPEGRAPIAMVPPTRTSYKAFGHVCISDPQPRGGYKMPLPQTNNR